MEFSLDRFYRLNRRAIIWIILFALIWLLRDFFTLIFLTFIIGFFAAPATRFLMEQVRLGRSLALTTVYVAILGGYVACGWLIMPNLVKEVGALQKTLHDVQGNLPKYRRNFGSKYPNLARIADDYLLEAQKPTKTAGEMEEELRSDEKPGSGASEAATIEAQQKADKDRQDKIDAALQKITDDWRKRIQKELATVGQQVLSFGFSLLLAILFSYLILYDYFRLVKVVKSLRGSKLRDFYEEAGEPVVKFALAVGRGFQALAITAFLTTLLMLPILIAYRVPSITLLSVIVFLTGLMPVIGVVFQAAPLGLVALNAHGTNTALWILFWVALIHVINGYIVAPIIFGRHFRINPVLTLIIIFLGGSFFGVWGVILGIPVVTYLIRDVFAVPIVEELGAQVQPSPDAAAHAPGDRSLRPESDAPAQKL